LQKPYRRRIEPLATGWRSYAWQHGVFDTARRPLTELAEGAICTAHHLLLVTLTGGARELEVSAACGHRYSGQDRPGAVSFVPADCERQTVLRGVESEWASISLSPTLFEEEALGRKGAARFIATFTNRDDPVLAGMAAEFARIFRADGLLETLYCEAMCRAMAHHLASRYGEAQPQDDVRDWKLPPWRLRKIADHVEDHLDGEIRIADLATLIGLSAGHLHRAFRATLGKTPLEFITERRVQRAMQMLARETASIAEIALRVGFQSPSHFTRTFRRMVGVNPGDYRAKRGKA
jgi:AraC family transcriptional regulator